MIADAWASFVRLDGRGADEREKGTPGSTDPRVMPGTRTCGQRQADRSDVRQEFARKRARTGFEPLEIADGRQPFMPRVSHNPCLLMLPFRFAHAMRMRPLSVGRVESAFHPARCHYGNVHTFCKENATKIFSLLYRSGPGTAPAVIASAIGVKGQSRAPSRRPLRVACRTRTTQWETAARKTPGPFADGLANLSVLPSELPTAENPRERKFFLWNFSPAERLWSRRSSERDNEEPSRAGKRAEGRTNVRK